MPTIKDIAREAGVSHGTVSNVLNKTGKVSVEKIRLVEEAARRLGYVPNAQAQHLRQGIPTAAALILPSLQEDIYLDLYTALKTTLQSAGYEVMVYTTNDIAGNEENLLGRLPLSNLAAVVVASSLGERCLERYRTLGCPVVFVDREPARMRQGDAFISFDFAQAGRELGRHVLEKGWKRVAFFSAPSSIPHTMQLFGGLCSALEGQQVMVQRFSSDTYLAINKAFDILQGEMPFDAVLTSSTLRADVVATALRFSHFSPAPQIVSLGPSKQFPPAYYPIYEMDYSRMGVQIGEMLLARLRKKKPLPERTILPARGFPFAFPHVRKGAPQSLTMLTLDTPSTAALAKILPSFEEISGISIKFVCMPYDDLHAQIEMLNSSFCYDLIRMDVVNLNHLGPKTYLPLAQAGICAGDLSPKLAAHPAYDSYSFVDGTAYALPFDPSVQICLYRSDLFGDAMLSRAYYERYHEALTVPRTIEQYLRVAEFFTAACNPDSPTRYGTTMTCGSAMTAASDFLTYLLAEGRDIHEAGQIRLDTPSVVRAMENYQKMARFACQQQWWRDSVRLFADGDTAMTTVYSNYAAYAINSKHSSVVGKIGAAIVPGGTPLRGGGVIGICRYSQRIEACRQFFNWYYTQDTASMLVRLGGTSPLMDAHDDFQNFSIFPWLDTAKKSLEVGVRGISREKIPDFSIRHYEFALGSAVRNLLSGAATPARAAAMARSRCENAGAGGCSPGPPTEKSPLLRRFAPGKGSFCIGNKGRCQARERTSRVIWRCRRAAASCCSFSGTKGSTTPPRAQCITS